MHLVVFVMVRYLPTVAPPDKKKQGFANGSSSFCNGEVSSNYSPTRAPAPDPAKHLQQPGLTYFYYRRSHGGTVIKHGRR